MKILVRNEQGVTILNLKGKITIGVGDVALRSAVHEALEAGARNILLELGAVTTVDSSGIGEMVNAFTIVKDRGGSLKLVDLPSKVADILQITQLIRVFEVYEDLDEALKSFQT